MRRILAVLAVAALAGLGWSWLGSGRTGGPGAPGDAGPTVGRTPRPTSSPGLKDAPAGLYLTEAPESATFGFIDHAVIGIDWSELEPAADDFGGPGWRRIDETLRDHPGFRFRLRIAAGRGAPEWLKDVEGGCVDVTQPASGLTACVPRFWTDAYLDEYAELMAEVARRYDDEPRILDVVNSACMTMWTEPFIRAGRDEASNLRLFEAGLNEDSDRYCLRRSTRVMVRAFERTRTSIATHLQWQIVTADGVEPSWPKQRNMLNNLLAAFGEEIVIQNNGLGGDEGCTREESPVDATEMWCWLAAIRYPKGFQTEGDRKLEASGFVVQDAIRRALGMGACFVEHNAFGDSASAARVLDTRLKANCPPG